MQSLEPVILQKVLNDLKSDNQRKKVKIILGDILDKAMRNDLLIKNPAKHLITQIDNEYPKRRRVLMFRKLNYFLNIAKSVKSALGEKTMCLVRDDQGSYFEIHTPKTFYGNRIIPLTSKCVETLMRQKN